MKTRAFLLFLQVFAPTLRPSTGFAQPQCNILWAPTAIYDDEDCGERSPLQARIINGSDVSHITQAPWLASILTKKNGTSHLCTGAIVHPRFVLTAAHCTYPRFEFTETRPNVSVFVGSLRFRRGIMRTVQAIYNWDIKAHDIVLLKLNESLPVDREPWHHLCIAEHEDIGIAKHCKARLFGWGDTDPENNTGIPPLQKLDVKILEVGSRQCHPRSTDESIVCAQGKRRLARACRGDSGGPLVVYYGRKAFLAGVYSYGRRNCRDTPGTYTRPSFFSDSIRNIIGASRVETPREPPSRGAAFR